MPSVGSIWHYLGKFGLLVLFALVSSRIDIYFAGMYDGMRFKSKSELAEELGIHVETLRLKLKAIDGLETGRRQLLYPRELKVIYRILQNSVASNPHLYPPFRHPGCHSSYR